MVGMVGVVFILFSVKKVSIYNIHQSKMRLFKNYCVYQLADEHQKVIDQNAQYRLKRH